MSKNTEKLQRKLAEIGIESSVEWVPIGSTGGVGIEGFYAEKVQNHPYFEPELGRIVNHCGWLGDTVNYALCSIEKLKPL